MSIIPPLQIASNELDTLQDPANKMSTAAQQVVSALRQLPTSDLPPVEQNVSSTHEALDSAKDLVAERIGKLEKQLVVWEQVASREKALESWLECSVAGLQEGPGDSEDFDQVRVKLDQFQVRGFFLFCKLQKLCWCCYSSYFIATMIIFDLSFMVNKEMKNQCAKQGTEPRTFRLLVRHSTN